MPEQRGQRLPERLGPVGHQLTQPHPFRRVIGVDERHLPRVRGLDLGQRIPALRREVQGFPGHDLGLRDMARIGLHGGQLGQDARSQTSGETRIGQRPAAQA